MRADTTPEQENTRAAARKIGIVEYLIAIQFTSRQDIIDQVAAASVAGSRHALDFVKSTRGVSLDEAATMVLDTMRRAVEKGKHIGQIKVNTGLVGADYEVDLERSKRECRVSNAIAARSNKMLQHRGLPAVKPVSDENWNKSRVRAAVRRAEHDYGAGSAQHEEAAAKLAAYEQARLDAATVVNNVVNKSAVITPQARPRSVKP